MPIPAATECLTYAEDALRTALSQCSAIQTWLGTPGNAAATLLLIKVDSLGKPANLEVYEGEVDGDTEYVSLMPYVIVTTRRQDGYFVQRTASPELYVSGGFLEVHIGRLLTTNESNTVEDTFRVLGNTLGRIIRELTEVAWDYILLEQIRATLPSFAESEDDEPNGLDEVVMKLGIPWGLA